MFNAQLPRAGGEVAMRNWLHKSHILSQFDVGHRHLDRWVEAGYVRTVKLDPRKQGRRLYSADDIASVLVALSAGREPKRVAGRGGAA